MKVVTKQDLYNYPKGTVYSDYADGVVDGLYIKTESIENEDWCVIDILDPEFNGEPYEMIDSLEKGESIPYAVSRENNSDLDNFEGLFLVYDINDVKKIIEVLKNTLKQL